MNGVDDAVVVVGEEEAVGSDAQNAAGTAFDFAVFEEAGEEAAGLAVGGGEADDAVAGADAEMAGSVEGYEKSVGKSGIGGVEELKAKRGAVGGEGGVDGWNL